MKKKYSFEAQLTQLSLFASVPLLLLLLWVMIYSNISTSLILLTAFLSILVIAYTNYRIYQKSEYQFRSLSNLLDAMIQGDYSLRAPTNQNYGALDELVMLINGLAVRLSQQRWESIESQLLVKTVIDHIDVAIVALTGTNKISFLNPAAKKLLLFNQEEVSSELLEQLTFVQSFSSGSHQVVELSLGRHQGRFNVHIEEFRESGLQHKLLFITDVRTLLRSEERKAWQSLVRVISHEINNSLSPIASISETLNRMIARENHIGPGHYNDLVEGLSFIAERANGLSQFVNSYGRLTKLPEPQKKQTSILGLLNKICILFKEESILLETNVDVQLFIDPIQFEQVLINIFKNAIESMSQVNSNGVVSVKWAIENHWFNLTVCDQGGGVSNSDNVFVPFYTTKKQGSGIGLVLSRQIIEAHNGNISITNKTNSRGCCVAIEIPYSDQGLTFV